ncbi:hypothetical protein SUDANB145_06324 [Streptomyces sp. enrichment culture]
MNITSGAIATAQAVFDEMDPPGPHYGMATTGQAKLAHLVHTLDLAERLRGTGVSVPAADPGPAATDNAAQMTIDIIPPALRPHWEQIRQGVTTPVADAARAPPAAACDPQLHGRTGVVIGSAGTPDDALLGFVTPEVTAGVRQWTARLLGAAPPDPDGATVSTSWRVVPCPHRARRARRSRGPWRGRRAEPRLPVGWTHTVGRSRRSILDQDTAAWPRTARIDVRARSTPVRASGRTRKVR